MDKYLFSLFLLLFATSSFSQSPIPYTDRHLLGDHPLKENEAIDLDESQWLFFDEVKPNDVIARYRSQISVNG